MPPLILSSWRPGTDPDCCAAARPVPPDPASGLHVCFRAPSRAAVDAFYRAALAAGGRDNGAPGEREYEPGYYAAFVIDPDGYRLEAYCGGGQT